MALAQAEKSHETTYTLDDAMDILLGWQSADDRGSVERD